MLIQHAEYEALAQLAERLRAMGHPIRLMIISQLKRGERSVGELAQLLDLPIATVSQHLKVMERAGLLGSRRSGRQIHYAIHASMVAGICSVLCQEMDSEIQESQAKREVFKELKRQLMG